MSRLPVRRWPVPSLVSGGRPASPQGHSPLGTGSAARRSARREELRRVGMRRCPGTPSTAGSAGWAVRPGPPRPPRARRPRGTPRRRPHRHGGRLHHRAVRGAAEVDGHEPGVRDQARDDLLGVGVVTAQPLDDLLIALPAGGRGLRYGLTGRSRSRSRFRSRFRSRCCGPSCDGAGRGEQSRCP